VITAIAGGVGAARLLRGLVEVVDPSAVTAVVNTGDDMVFCGLHISPDLDSVTRMLAGTFDHQRGFGATGESWRVMEELGALGGETWFALGDRDLATHLYRSRRLECGAPLSEVAGELARASGVAMSLLPMTDDPVATRLRLAPDGSGAPGAQVAFQEYFAKLHHAVPVASVHFDGAEAARPAPGVLEALRDAERIIICPSNPVLSIAPVLAVPGIRQMLEARRADVVAVSPLIGGKAVKGPADHLMAELGMEPSAVGVGRAYRDVAGTLWIDDIDAHLAPQVEALDMRCLTAPTLVAEVPAAAALCRQLLGP